MGLISGVAISWSSPVLAKLKDQNNLQENPFGRVVSKDEDASISSLLALGAVFGPFLNAFLADKIGRKPTLITLAVPFVAAFLILAYSKIVPLYYIARIVMGAAMGGVYAVTPMYIGEVAEINNRGLLSSSFNVFICSGILFSYVTGPHLSIPMFNVAAAMIPSVFIALCILLVPESPYYLIGVDEVETATRSLKKLRTIDITVSKEIESIRDEINQSSQGHFLDLFRSRGLLKAFVISISLASFQQLSGINIVLFNAQTIFEATGSETSSAISSILIGTVQFGSSFVTPIVVDKLGRKLLLIISGFGMCLAQIPIGLFFYLKETAEVDEISWLPVASLVLYITVYNCGFGPLPWTIMGELFPPNVKSVASSLRASICWFLGFIITRYFTSVSDSIGMGGSFLLFSGLCLISTIFTFRYVPETKGKSFQEIQKLLGG